MIRSMLSGPLSGYIVSAVAVAGSVVISALGHPVPDQLWSIAAVGLGAGAGATVPTRYAEGTPPAASTSSATTPTRPVL